MTEWERRLRKLEARTPPLAPGGPYRYTWADWTDAELEDACTEPLTEAMQDKLAQTKPRHPSDPDYVELSHLSDEELQREIAKYDEE